ncbi:hypothetical protein AAFF_G00197510, partial [Aldrovandia affinis]
DDVRIKFEFCGQRRMGCFGGQEVKEKVKTVFGQHLDLHYMNNELCIPLHSHLLDCSFSMKSIKILLVTQEQDVSSPSQATVCKQVCIKTSQSTGDVNIYQSSKPRGHHLSSSSQNAGRSFPPIGLLTSVCLALAPLSTDGPLCGWGVQTKPLDPWSSAENPVSSGCQSLDSSSDSPSVRKSWMHRAKSCPDNRQDHSVDRNNHFYDKVMGKGGTYPRRYHVSPQHKDHSEG